MNDILYQITDFIGPFGSSHWWILGGLAASVFLAIWARAIRTLLPFVGAGTIIALLLWAMSNAGLITLNFSLL